MQVAKKYIKDLSAGDLFEQTFSGAQSASGANITGFVFDPLVVRSFEAVVSVHIDATADLTARYNLYGINKSGTWSLSVGNSLGDSGSNSISFDINSSTGQITYSSSTYAGFVSMSIKFRAVTTSV